MSVVLDTHAAIWYALDSDRLSEAARTHIDAAYREGRLYLASITVVEVIYLVEKGRLPELALQRLLDLLRLPGARISVVPLDLDVAEALRQVERTVIPDMPDRIIAATARRLGLPLVTRDFAIQSSDIETIW